MNQLVNMNRSLKMKISQIFNSNNPWNHGDLPSKTEVNHREHAKDVPLEVVSN